jgi:hypothetical protein
MRLLLLSVLAAGLARAGTIAEFVQSVRAALVEKRADTEVASMVAQAKLDERLTGAVIEQLESEGAGPRTVEELEWQREASRGLADPKGVDLPAPGPPPPAEEQARLIEEARAIALQYTANLPDFLCTENILRYVQPGGKPWKTHDTLTIDVAFSEKGERYKPLAIDGKPTTKSVKSIGGFTSNGEFGSTLRFIFRPESAARFRWERWGNLRGKRVAVFAFHIEQKNSSYTVNARAGMFKRYGIVTGAVGLVYIEPETRRTLRFSEADDGLPPDFPIRETWSSLDYDYVEIGAEKFLLPRRFDMWVVTRNGRLRNVTKFENYRKFSSEATVTFEK